MDNHFDAIARELKCAADFKDAGDASAYIDFLERVLHEVKQARQAAMLTEFGKQFKPAGAPVSDPDAPRQFAPDQKVRTKEGYIGIVAGHDKRGHAIVNVVWQACEYPEGHLAAIPDASALESMRPGNEQHEQKRNA